MKIAAFNVKNLGIKKVTDKTVVQYLTKILSRYSVVVVLEVVDKSGEAMKTLLEELNSLRSSKKNPYLMVSSCPLGRDTYKEQFVCFYRKDEVALKACYQYADDRPGDKDVFAREPFALLFSCPTTAIKDPVLIPVHTKPEDSLKELDELHIVVQAVRENWGNDNIVILGDFNADGRYLSKKKLETIRIRSEGYHWLIQDDVDTTSSNHNDHTYDRIVVFGEKMLNAVVPGSATTFNFQKEFKLDDDTALSISDHYPVEVKLRTGPQKHAVPWKRKAPAINNSKGGRKKRSAPKRKKKAAKRLRGECSGGSKSPAKRRCVQKR